MSTRKDLNTELASDERRETPRANELSNDDDDVTLDEPDTLASSAEDGDEESDTPPSSDRV